MDQGIQTKAQEIRSFDVKQTLENLGYQLRITGKNFSTKPLYRDSDNKTALSIDKNTGVWFDFVTGKGGSFEALCRNTLKYQNGYSNEETRDGLESLLVLSGSNINKYKNQIIYRPTISENLIQDLKKDYTYWNNRKISNKTLDLFKCGVTLNPKIYKRFTFPIYREDKLIGVAARDLTNKRDIKWKLIGNKAKWVFPNISLPYIKKAKFVILVESIGDMLSLYDAGIKNVLVTFGLYIGKQIIIDLIQNNIERVMICFNNDDLKKSAANRAAIREKRRLNEFFKFNNIIINLPPKGDFNEMTHKEIVEWVKSK